MDVPLRPVRRALAVIREILQRALAVGGHLLQRALALVPNFLRRPLHPPRPCTRPRAETPPPPPPPPPQKKYADMYADDPNDPRRRPRHASLTTSSPPQPPPRRRPIFFEGVQVPDREIDLYVEYCTKPCSAKSTVCHFCIFEKQKSGSFTVPTASVYLHCSDYHRQEGAFVRCNQPGCKVMVRPGRDGGLHILFCHQFDPDWWKEYV